MDTTITFTDAEMTELKHAVEVHNDMNTDRAIHGEFGNDKEEFARLANIHSVLFKVGGSIHPKSGFSK